LTNDELEAGLDEILLSPPDAGVLSLIVRRPAEDHRDLVETGELTIADGLAGDNWRHLALEETEGNDPDPATQITIMNSRAIALIAGDKQRWALAGDQLYVDLDISFENLPPGAKLAIGKAVVEISQEPHTGCRKFSDRYGIAAVRFVNSPTGRKLRLRGLNARVVEAGTVTLGDPVTKIPSTI
jgi:hypothetical protein